MGRGYSTNSVCVWGRGYSTQSVCVSVCTTLLGATCTLLAQLSGSGRGLHECLASLAHDVAKSGTHTTNVLPRRPPVTSVKSRDTSVHTALQSASTIKGNEQRSRPRCSLPRYGLIELQGCVAVHSPAERNADEVQIGHRCGGHSDLQEDSPETGEATTGTPRKGVLWTITTTSGSSWTVFRNTAPPSRNGSTHDLRG